MSGSMHAALGAAASALLVSVALSLAGRWIGVLTDPEKSPVSETTPFLGGQAPLTHAWNRFHVRYYAVALLFVAFEMEMMFMYPWAVVFVEEGIKALVEMGMFLFILSLGIVYAWREGAFKWQ